MWVWMAELCLGWICEVCSTPLEQALCSSKCTNKQATKQKQKQRESLSCSTSNAINKSQFPMVCDSNVSTHVDLMIFHKSRSPASNFLSGRPFNFSLTL